LQLVPWAKQVAGGPASCTQHDVESEQVPLQQSWVDPPQSVHFPAVQKICCPPVPVVQAVLLPTHVLSALSQQPVPLHA
jgi:hypothetical protein